MAQARRRGNIERHFGCLLGSENDTRKLNFPLSCTYVLAAPNDDIQTFTSFIPGVSGFFYRHSQSTSRVHLLDTSGSWFYVYTAVLIKESPKC